MKDKGEGTDRGPEKVRVYTIGQVPQQAEAIRYSTACVFVFVSSCSCNNTMMKGNLGEKGLFDSYFQVMIYL